MAQSVRVVAHVGETGVRRWQLRKQTVGGPVITDVSAGYGKRDQAADGVGYRMDFGALPTA